MKTAIRTIVPLAALAAAAQAAPFLAVGDSAELFLTGTLGVRADDNILLTEKKTDDIIFEITPGFDLVYGNGSLTKGHIIYKETISQYSDNSKLDNELSSVSADGVYDDKKTSIKFATSWEQQAQNSVDIRNANATTLTRNSLIRRDVFKIGGSSEVSVTEKSTVGAGVNYEDINYLRAGYEDVKYTTVPVNYFYEFTPKVDLGFGFRFRQNDLATGIDSKDYFYNVAARGEFTPKLTGTVAVGYTQRDFKTGSDKGTFGFDGSLAYAVDEKTSITAGLTNDFAVAANGNAQRNISSSLGVTSKVAADWTAGAKLAYRQLNYITGATRTDDYLEGSLEASYTLNANISFTGSYTYRDLDSELKGYDFKNNVFAISANIRY